MGALLLLGAGGASGQAWAADDGYQNVFSSVLTAVGVMTPDPAPEIEYRERPPLVLPPKQDLTQPEPAGAHRTAAWPQDPDVVRRAKEKEALKAPIVSLFDKSRDRPDSKTEMLRHRAAQTEPDPAPGMEHCHADCRLSVYDMRKQDEKYRAQNPEKKDTLTAGVEPEREYLTQPPPGYMKATKTVKATAEAPQYRQNTASPLSSLIDHPVGPTPDSPNQ